MKLLKKILPIATVASIAGVVTPMVTSCSSGLLTNSSLEFSVKAHEAVEGGWTQEEATNDYFSTNKHLVEDLAYVSVNIGYISYPYGGHKKCHDEWMDKADNAKYEFKTTIKKVELAPKTTTIDSKEVKGYLLNAVLVDDVYTIGDAKTPRERFSKEHIEDRDLTTITIKDAFVYLEYKTNWMVNIKFINEASKKWSKEERTEESYKQILTFKDGHVISDGDSGVTTEYISYEIGSEEQEAMNSFASPYLLQVGKKE